MRRTRSTYTTIEAAQITGFHPQTIRRAIRADELKAAGEQPYRISATELKKWWRERGGGELTLPQVDGQLEVENPVTVESAVQHAREVAGGLRTLGALGEEHGLNLPDVEAMADEIESAVTKTKR